MKGPRQFRLQLTAIGRLEFEHVESEGAGLAKATNVNAVHRRVAMGGRRNRQRERCKPQRSEQWGRPMALPAGCDARVRQMRHSLCSHALRRARATA